MKYVDEDKLKKVMRDKYGAEQKIEVRQVGATVSQPLTAS